MKATISMRNNILLVMMIALGMASCDRQTVYHHFEHVPDNEWEKIDTLKFEIGPVIETGTYHEAVELRINEQFPFLGMNITVEQTIKPRGIILSQHKDCELINTDGSHKGSGISFFQSQFPLDDIDLQQGDTLCISVFHSMKRDIMPGISDIGIRLSRAH